MLKLRVYPEALSFLKSLGGKQVAQITLKIFALAVDPKPNDSALIKGTDGYFRADIGEFRIVYRVVDDTVDVPLIGRRNDDEIYKQVKRKGL